MLVSERAWTRRPPIPLNDNGKNACLTGGLGNAITHVSAHTGIPDSTGSNEAAGGSYARQSVSWAAASSGTRSNSGTITFDVNAGTYYAIGFWSALTTGTHYGWAPINGTTRGFGTVDSTDVSNDTITSNGHGLTTNDAVIIEDVFAESLPTGLAVNTIYYVISTGLTTDVFKVSTSVGGAAVNLTGQGELYFQKIVPETFASAGQISIAASALVLDATGI